MVKFEWDRSVLLVIVYTVLNEQIHSPSYRIPSSTAKRKAYIEHPSTNSASTIGLGSNGCRSDRRLCPDEKPFQN